MPELTLHTASLWELAKLTQDGKLMYIAKTMVKRTPLLLDLHFIQCNNKTSHKTAQETDLPKGYTRIYNRGVAASHPGEKIIDEPTKMRETYSKVDAGLAKLNGVEQYRKSKDSRIIRGMSFGTAQDLYYGVEKTDGIDGLLTRLGATDGELVMDHGDGAVDGAKLTSIVIVQHGDDYCHAIFPEGSKAGGVEFTDKTPGGKTETASDGNGGEYEIFRSHFKHDYGLAVPNVRSIRAVRNINWKDLDGFDENFLIALLEDMPDGGDGAVIYLNGKASALTTIRGNMKSNVNHTATDPFGRPVRLFQGRWPMRIDDAISDDETAVPEAA